MLFPTDASFAHKIMDEFSASLCPRFKSSATPLWVKQLLDRWLAAAGITDGALFCTLRKKGALDRKSEELFGQNGSLPLTPNNRENGQLHTCRRAVGYCTLPSGSKNYWWLEATAVAILLKTRRNSGPVGQIPGETAAQVTGLNRSRSESGNRELMRSGAIPR